jgi:MFS family permease
MILGLTHLGGGFVRQKIALLVLRALGGVGGALTIPAALSMIVALFPDPRSQSRALAIFGGMGTLGNSWSLPCTTMHRVHSTLPSNSPWIDPRCITR